MPYAKGDGGIGSCPCTRTGSYRATTTGTGVNVVAGWGAIMDICMETLEEDKLRRREMFSERVENLDDLKPGYALSFAAFERHLLQFGGWAVVPTFEADCMLDLLLEHGRYTKADSVEYLTMKPSACHENVAEWFLQQDGVDSYVCTGYALSRDGLWRQHSWGMRGGDIVETTCEREAYFGLSYRPKQVG